MKKITLCNLAALMLTLSPINIFAEGGSSTVDGVTVTIDRVASLDFAVNATSVNYIVGVGSNDKIAKKQNLSTGSKETFSMPGYSEAIAVNRSGDALVKHSYPSEEQTLFLWKEDGTLVELFEIKAEAARALSEKISEISPEFQLDPKRISYGRSDMNSKGDIVVTADYLATHYFPGGGRIEVKLSESILMDNQGNCKTLKYPEEAGLSEVATITDDGVIGGAYFKQLLTGGVFTFAAIWNKEGELIYSDNSRTGRIYGSNNQSVLGSSGYNEYKDGQATTWDLRTLEPKMAFYSETGGILKDIDYSGNIVGDTYFDAGTGEGGRLMFISKYGTEHDIADFVAEEHYKYAIKMAGRDKIVLKVKGEFPGYNSIIYQYQVSK